MSPIISVVVRAIIGAIAGFFLGIILGQFVGRVGGVILVSVAEMIGTPNHVVIGAILGMVVGGTVGGIATVISNMMGRKSGKLSREVISGAIIGLIVGAAASSTLTTVVKTSNDIGKVLLAGVFAAGSAGMIVGTLAGALSGIRADGKGPQYEDKDKTSRWSAFLKENLSSTVEEQEEQTVHHLLGMNTKMLMTVILLLGIGLPLTWNLFSNLSSVVTIQPTPTPIPGWEKFEGAGVELWLPERFEGGDLSQDLEVIVSELRALGSDFEQYAKAIEQNPSAFAILVFDSQAGNSGSLTSVNIVQEKVGSGVTIDTYADAVAKQLSSNFRIMGRKKIKLDHYEAMQVVVELELPGAKVKELIYVIKHNDVMWVITYGTEKSEYEQWLPVFEKSANTFYVQL